MTYRHYRQGVTLGMVVNSWVDRHPYLGFLAFLGIMFALMALCGLSDGPERAAQIGGV
jgi:hypothetical protein